MSKPSVFQRIKQVFRRGHPDIYAAVKDYAKESGARVDDVIGAALASYLSTSDEGKEALEDAMAARRESGGGGAGGMKGIKEALEIFKDMADTTVSMMTSAQEAGQKLLRGSLLTELKSQAETIEEIKRIGGESGKGSIEDILATALINKLLAGAGVKTEKGSKGRKVKSGTGNVDEVEE